MEQRIIELELRSTQQEDTIQKLSDVIWAQEKRLDALEAQLGRLRQHVASEPWTPGPPADEKPPHY